MDTEQSFMDYWNAVDSEMMALYGSYTMAAYIPTADMIAEAQEALWTPREFVLWFGDNNGLTKLPGAA